MAPPRPPPIHGALGALRRRGRESAQVPISDSLGPIRLSVRVCARAHWNRFDSCVLRGGRPRRCPDGTGAAALQRVLVSGQGGASRRRRPPLLFLACSRSSFAFWRRRNLAGDEGGGEEQAAGGCGLEGQQLVVVEEHG